MNKPQDDVRAAYITVATELIQENLKIACETPISSFRCIQRELRETENQYHRRGFPQTSRKYLRLS